MEQLRAMGFGRAAPDEEEHDADAEERAGIQEYDGGGATGPVLEVYEI